MSSPRDEFALLLAAPHPTEADLAKDLLASDGIPCLLHGQDRDLAELGAGHAGIARPDLLVPKAALVRAREILDEAWGGGPVSDEVALACAAPVIEVPASPSRALPWILFVGFVASVSALVLARYFAARTI